MTSAGSRRGVAVTLAHYAARICGDTPRASKVAAMPNPPLNLSGRAIVVTGASSGIGAATATALSASGAEVWALARTASSADPTSERCLDVDLTEADQVTAAAATITNALGDTPLHGIVHAAGIGRLGPAIGIAPAEIDAVIATNLNGPLVLTSALFDSLGDDSRVIFIGSRAGSGAARLNGPYGASKAAIRSIASTMRVEMEPLGVHVCEIVPGAVRTGLRDGALQTLSSATERVMNRHPSAPHHNWADALRGAAASSEVSAEAVAASIVSLLSTASPPARTHVPRSEQLRGALRQAAGTGAVSGLVRSIRSARSSASRSGITS